MAFLAGQASTSASDRALTVFLRNGTAGSTFPDGVVVHLQTRHADQKISEQIARADDRGEFVFLGLSDEPGLSFRALADYGSVTYACDWIIKLRSLMDGLFPVADRQPGTGSAPQVRSSVLSGRDLAAGRVLTVRLAGLSPPAAPAIRRPMFAFVLGGMLGMVVSVAAVFSKAFIIIINRVAALSKGSGAILS